MKTMDKRQQERKAKNQADRNQRKRSKAPIVVDVMVGSVLMTLAISEAYAPILKFAEDNTLLDIATKYKIPLTEEQRFLVQAGDTLLPQFQKVQLTEEQETKLLVEGWAPLISSNLQAVRIDGDDLLIKFHSDAVYRYPEQSNMYFPFNEALSPGRLLWRTIRTIRGYERIE
jgi:hypothetical protein